MRCISIFIALLTLTAAASAQSPSASPPATPARTIGVKPSPPFVIKQNDGSWSGISIELWRDIAEALQITYTLREYDLQGLLQAVQQSDIDAAVGALSITSERERVMDFTHPFYNTGLSIAVAEHSQWPILTKAKRIMSREFFAVLALLFTLLLLLGVIIWLCERRRNPQQFGGNPLHGIGAGLWWAAVTMTTVGYGDKTPVTLLGRVVALVWMYMALILLTSFVAAITAVLTLSELSSSIDSPADLTQYTIATVTASSSETYLAHHHLSRRPYPSLAEALQAVSSGEADAAVYDEALLHYLMLTEFAGQVRVLPFVFARQSYGIALPSGSALREPVNQALLKITRQEAWQGVLERYLGERKS